MWVKFLKISFWKLLFIQFFFSKQDRVPTQVPNHNQNNILRVLQLRLPRKLINYRSKFTSYLGDIILFTVIVILLHKMYELTNKYGKML